ncbi:MAG: hypothetical protein R3C53_08190 [Pirellulaceae bacterium]
MTETNEDQNKKKEYLDKLVRASPGSETLKKNSGMDIDLSKLTAAGWCLAILTILVAGAAVLIPILMYTESGNRTGGGIARAIGLPIAIVAGGGTFWLGKLFLTQLGLSVTRPE